VNYTVAKGECVSTVAKKNNLPWRKIAEDASNKALADKRKNLNVLAPGDVLTVPDKQPKTASVDTGLKHQIQVTGQLAKLRLKLVDAAGAALGETKYSLVVGGKKYEDKVKDGLIDQFVDPTVLEGTLKLWLAGEDKPPAEWKLAIGELLPTSEDKSVQQRLRNLGYETDAVDGKLAAPGTLTPAAIKAFQKKAGLDEDGKDSADLRDKLRSTHGC